MDRRMAAIDEPLLASPVQALLILLMPLMDRLLAPQCHRTEGIYDLGPKKNED